MHGGKGNGALFYYSVKFMNTAGIALVKAKVSRLQELYKNALFGANMSPTGYFKIADTDGKNTQGCVLYIGSTYQWVRVFREGALTLPWGEDWAWQTPIGTQQMMTMSIDAFRSGVFWAGAEAAVSPAARSSTWDAGLARYVRLKNKPKHVDMLMYVMKHYPGNTDNSWTRQFFGDLAHGVNRFDLFLFEPSTSGYTCDYVDADGGAYPTVRKALNMLGSFEDIVETGAVTPAAVAILYSETSDTWQTTAGTCGTPLVILLPCCTMWGKPTLCA